MTLRVLLPRIEAIHGSQVGWHRRGPSETLDLDVVTCIVVALGFLLHPERDESLGRIGRAVEPLSRRSARALEERCADALNLAAGCFG